MDLRSRVVLLIFCIVNSLCHLNGVIDSVNNSDASDNFMDNVNGNVVGIDTDTHSDATTFDPSLTTDDRISILDCESCVEEPSIIKRNLTGDSVDDPTASINPNLQPDTPTRIPGIYPPSDFSNRDSGTTTSKPGSDSVVISIENYLPEIERLCPGTNVCGRTRDNEDTLTTYAINHCCLNCSCEPSCIYYQNCCYDELVTDSQYEMFDCLMPIVGDYDMNSMSELQTYRFVVAPPIDGCKTADDIKKEDIRNVDENESPWGDFYPIYSKYFNLNFKNERIANCHGARDIEFWKPIAVNRGNYAGGQVMTYFLSTLNSSAVFIAFEPPRTELKHRDYMCFRRYRDSCPLRWINTFKIPSYIQTDRNEIVAACEHGPHALYWFSPKFAYKNVYCALCNQLVLSPPSYDNVYCGYRDVDGRQPQFRSFLVVLLDSDFINSVRTQSADLRAKPTDLNCYRPENYVNDVGCVPLQCPMFQIHLADSKCGYPSEVLLIESIYVRLNLSTSIAIDAAFFNNLTEAEVYSLFQRFSPWTGCWVIQRIGLRLETHTTEFTIQLDCKAKQFNLSNINKSLRKLLSSTWVIHFNNTRTYFKQKLDKHGETSFFGNEPNRRDIFTPEWASLTDRPIKTSSLLKKVFWTTLYEGQNYIASYNLPINKLFFCNQIELTNIEYELQYTILYIKRVSIYLYPEEFSLFEDEFGEQRARVCFEDSAYIKAGSVPMTMHWYLMVVIFICLEPLATLSNRVLFE